MTKTKCAVTLATLDVTHHHVRSETVQDLILITGTLLCPYYSPEDY